MNLIRISAGYQIKGDGCPPIIIQFIYRPHHTVEEKRARMALHFYKPPLSGAKVPDKGYSLKNYKF